MQIPRLATHFSYNTIANGVSKFYCVKNGQIASWQVGKKKWQMTDVPLNGLEPMNQLDSHYHKGYLKANLEPVNKTIRKI